MLNTLYQALDPVAFSVGPFSVRWYGLAYVAGFICVISVVYFVGKRWDIRLSADSLCTILLCAMIGIILGARLGYVLVYNWDAYAANPVQILNFSNGGMSFHGGLVGALIAAVVASRLLKMPYLSLVDLAMVGVPIALFFGRCANFVNGELWGSPTDLPWGVVFGGAAGTEMRHPSQLYEALFEGVFLFVLLCVLARLRPPLYQGAYTGVFLLVYGLCRFCVEFIRQPDVQIGYIWGGWLTMGQVLSIPLVVFGLVLLLYAATYKRLQEGPKGESL